MPLDDASPPAVAIFGYSHSVPVDVDGHRIAHDRGVDAHGFNHAVFILRAHRFGRHIHLASA